MVVAKLVALDAIIKEAVDLVCVMWYYQGLSAHNVEIISLQMSIHTSFKSQNSL